MQDVYAVILSLKLSLLLLFDCAAKYSTGDNG